MNHSTHLTCTLLGFESGDELEREWTTLVNTRFGSPENVEDISKGSSSSHQDAQPADQNGDSSVVRRHIEEGTQRVVFHLADGTKKYVGFLVLYT